METDRDLTLKIGWLYPTLMSTYGDRGNVTSLVRRSQWRGIGADVIELDLQASASDIADVDVLVGGGAQDREQEIVMRDLRGEKADALRQQIENGTPGLFTCGSPQLLGRYYEPAEGERIPGLGVFDLVTVHPGPQAHRCIGNLVYELTAPRLVHELRSFVSEAPLVVGFENHGGRTVLGEVEPLGRVVRGFGNNGEDGTEGAFYHNAIATYSHGPLLSKNPFIADWLIHTALLIKYGQLVTLAPLDDSLAEQARRVMFRRLRVALPEQAPTVPLPLSLSGLLQAVRLRG